MTLNKICNHWTAGTNKPCTKDIESYHYLIDKYGKIYKGKYKPEDNINCNDGKYAKHCGNGNTNCIGISLCGMFNFTESKKQTKYPLTQKQVETLCALNAYLSIKYKFDITEKSIFTHYEFDKKQPKSKRKGKIDIIYLPFLPNLHKDSVGNYIRNKSNWYKSKFIKGKYKLVKEGDSYEIICTN